MLAREDPPELLLNMKLDDTTNMKLAGALRRNPASCGIRLVALPVDALPEQIGAALASGFET